MFVMASLTILSLAHTIKLHGKRIYSFVWWDDGLFLTTLIATLSIIFVLICMSIVYVCCFSRKVNRDEIAK
jgi:hypothetical protein